MGGFQDGRLPARIKAEAPFTTLLGQNTVVLTKNSRKQDIKVENRLIKSKTRSFIKGVPAKSVRTQGPPRSGPSKGRHQADVLSRT